MAQAELEDSTSGVANILQRKLQQMELEDSEKLGVKSIARNHIIKTQSLSSDAGHSSGVVTECEEDQDRANMELAPGTRVVYNLFKIQLKNISQIALAAQCSFVMKYTGFYYVHILGRPLPHPASQNQEDVQSNGSHDHDDTPPCNDILGIIVHGTDELQASIHLTHPSVRVSIVDVSDRGQGSMLKKSIPEKCVTSYYERGNPSVDYILPILTQPYESRLHRY